MTTLWRQSFDFLLKQLQIMTAITSEGMVNEQFFAYESNKLQWTALRDVTFTQLRVIYALCMLKTSTNNIHACRPVTFQFEHANFYRIETLK